MAATWTAQRERSNPAALSVATWIALHLGRRVARLLLPPTVLYYLVFAGHAARAASRNYLRRALGREPTWRDGYRHVHAFGSATLDRLYFLNDRRDLFALDVHGPEVIRSAMHGSRGRAGAVVMGAHMGSFEAVRAAGHVERDLRVAMVMYEDNARYLNAALAAINPRLAQSTIALGRVDSMLRVKAALDDGWLVGLLPDRTLAEGEGDGVRCATLLGGAIEIPEGPFRLAAMMRRRVVFMVGLYRGGNRYEVHYEDLADFGALDDVPRGERAAATNEAIAAAVGRYVARLEHYCRAAPYNWFNFYDYWNDEG